MALGKKQADWCSLLSKETINVNEMSKVKFDENLEWFSLYLNIGSSADLVISKMFLTGVALKMHQAYFKNTQVIWDLSKNILPFSKNILLFSKNILPFTKNILPNVIKIKQHHTF